MTSFYQQFAAPRCLDQFNHSAPIVLRTELSAIVVWRSEFTSRITCPARVRVPVSGP